MSQSIGKQLMEARKKKGLTLEDVSFKTRIPQVRLNELENDDFSNFANLTYAKSFLKLYSEHLGLDIGGYLSEWDTTELANVYGRQYMQSATTSLTGLSVTQPMPRLEPRRGGTPWWLLGLALAGLIALPIWLMKNRGQEGNEEAPRKAKTETSDSAENPPTAKSAEPAPPLPPPPIPSNVPSPDTPPKAKPVGDVVPKIEDLPAPSVPDSTPPKPKIVPD